MCGLENLRINDVYECCKFASLRILHLSMNVANSCMCDFCEIMNFAFVVWFVWMSQNGYLCNFMNIVKSRFTWFCEYCELALFVLLRIVRIMSFENLWIVWFWRRTNLGYLWMSQICELMNIIMFMNVANSSICDFCGILHFVLICEIAN